MKRQMPGSRCITTAVPAWRICKLDVQAGRSRRPSYTTTDQQASYHSRTPSILAHRRLPTDVSYAASVVDRVRGVDWRKYFDSAQRPKHYRLRAIPFAHLLIGLQTTELALYLATCLFFKPRSQHMNTTQLNCSACGKLS